MAAKTWDELSKEEQCVLFTAFEHGTLMELLSDWEPGREWSFRVTQVPRMADAVIRAVDTGLIEVFWAPTFGEEGSIVPTADVPALAQDLTNWWTEDGPHAFVELLCTADGEAILATCPRGMLYSFRNH
jgi:hypothetical protein